MQNTNESDALILSLGHVSKNDYDGALVRLEDTICTNPELVWNLGSMVEWIYSNPSALSNTDRALWCINEIIKNELIEDMDFALSDKYHLLVYLKRYSEAFEAIDKAAELDDLHLKDKIACLFLLKKTKQAQHELINAISQNNDFDYIGLFTNLYSYKLFCDIKDLYTMLDYHNLFTDWICLWSSVELGDFKETLVILNRFKFKQENLFNDFEGILNADCNKTNISDFFSQEFSYEKIPLDQWVILLSKIFLDVDYQVPVQSIIKVSSNKVQFVDSTIPIQEELDMDFQNIIHKWRQAPIKYEMDHNQYQDISIKLELIDLAFTYYDNIPLEIQLFIRKMYIHVKDRLIAISNGIVEASILKERDRIMSNVSHSIKNMLRSVIDPLILIKQELPEKTSVIDSALKGANLIRAIVNSINLSYKTTLADIKYDIAHPDNEAISLEEMVVNSLKYSIGNMFDSKYFPAFMQNYFPTRSQYQKAKQTWDIILGTNSIEAIKEYTAKYMFELHVQLFDVVKYVVGNEKSSAIKLMILFQEIIFNAVKYCSYVPLSERHVKIKMVDAGKKILFEVSNTYKPGVQAKTTGVGKLVIENFTKVLESNAVITQEKGVYNLSMLFTDLWRENE